MDRSTLSSALRPSWDDSGDRTVIGPRLTSGAHRAKQGVRLMRAAGIVPWWLNLVVGTGMALSSASWLVAVATHVAVLALLGLVGIAMLLLGQHAIAKRQRCYFDDPAPGVVIALVLEELPDAIAARVVDQHRRWRACRPGDPVTLFLLALWVQTARDEHGRSQPPTVGERVVVRAQDRAFEEVGAVA